MRTRRFTPDELLDKQLVEGLDAVDDIQNVSHN